MNNLTHGKGSHQEAIISKTIPLKEPKKLQKGSRPNYALMHSKPLPIVTYPLPAFIPHNPLSLLHVAYAVIAQVLFPPTSHPHIYHGYFSYSTRSIHVTDPKDVRALWETGFFGKGSLSRSEPTWLDQEKKRIGLVDGETAEEITHKRRLEREKFKRERARLERQTLENQLRKESADPRGEIQKEAPENGSPQANNLLPESTVKGSQKHGLKRPGSMPVSESPASVSSKEVSTAPDLEIINQEHHQLSLEEAFFLVYGLGALKLNAPENALDNYSLLQLFRQHSYYPPVSLSELSPDDPFLLNYVVYHHFRSLGWVIRDGIKFAVDYVLYERGPVFKHAAFAIMIVPSYTHAYWQDPNLSPTRTQRSKSAKDWAWLHCTNRVQSQVVKTLVLVYVDVPPPRGVEERDIGKLLRSYRVREFCIQRWSANRNRD